MAQGSLTAHPPPVSEPGLERIHQYTPRFGRIRPVIAVVGDNGGTEVSDFVMPYGILAQSGLAEMVTVAPQSGPVQMLPALKLQADATCADFDVRFPEGADYVIMPAIRNRQEPIILEWLKSQSSKGATLVGICDGVITLGHAGVLKGHRATGHWATRSMREKHFPEATWLSNRRYVADEKLITTSGVTAAIPFSLALVEAIGGRERALAVAKELGAVEWTPVHNSESFHLGVRYVSLAIGHKLAFWSHERIAVPVAEGTDEIALSLVTDAYSRTFSSKAFTMAASMAPIRTRRGLTLLPEKIQNAPDAKGRLLPPFNQVLPIRALDWALEGIQATYGKATSQFVALQMEYSRP
jgi:putative intracellular protease/amidase